MLHKNDLDALDTTDRDIQKQLAVVKREELERKRNERKKQQWAEAGYVSFSIQDHSIETVKEESLLDDNSNLNFRTGTVTEPYLEENESGIIIQ